MHLTQRVTYVLILLSTVTIFQDMFSLMSHLLFSFCSKIPLSFSTNNFLASWHFQPVIHIISPSLHFTLTSWSSSYHCYLCKSICSSVCTLVFFFFFSASNFQLKLTCFHLRLFLTSLIIPATFSLIYQIQAILIQSKQGQNQGFPNANFATRLFALINSLQNPLPLQWRQIFLNENRQWKMSSMLFNDSKLGLWSLDLLIKKMLDPRFTNSNVILME